MSVAVSPMASEVASPMITSVTPTLDLDPRSKDGGEGPGEGGGGGLVREQDPARRPQKPPPLHTGADWKVVLHLPEIETWLRTTTVRVRDLTHSVHQDALNKHVDVHLVQLKDICEDISDHVEQIHALLETEFSLKLLSYSVNIIVDIRTVQLLWHQLRVSVLVLRERLLQGLQDSNGNYTRQTHILQAFSQDHDQARLDALTEVDDSGQLTIKCSQDYFSLDCGITAFELSDYSPGEEPEVQGQGQDRGPEPQGSCYPELEQDFPELIQSVGLLTVAAERLSSQQQSQASPGGDSEDTPSSLPDSPGDAQPGDAQPGETALSKRPLRDCVSCDDASPTRPSLPKKAMYPQGASRDDLTRAPPPSSSSSSSLRFQAEISRSTPSLLDPPDRSRFWLELTSVYPSGVSQSYDSVHAAAVRVGPAGGDPVTLKRSSSETGEAGDLEERPVSFHPSDIDPADALPRDDRKGGEGESPAPSHDPVGPAPPEADARTPPRAPPVHAPLEEEGTRPSPSGSSRMSSKEDRWYGSDEYLALPSQLRKTEMLALKLETLAKALPRRPSQGPLQDVDDWELSEAPCEWDPPAPAGLPHTRSYHSPPGMGRFSPTSSSDVAPSLDDSIESGPLSDLLSEDEAYWDAAESKRIFCGPRPLSGTGGSSGLHKPLIQQLLEDIRQQDNDQDVWGKIEGFVSKLDEFIRWLRESLESTENWTPPKAETDELRLYLETHLSFKLNVDGHCSLKDSVLDEGRRLLELIASHQSGLRDMLQMIAHQWQQLQRQVRRQHCWILRALEAIKAQILAQEGPQTLALEGSPKGEVQQCYREAQNDALDQMALRLNRHQYCSGSKRKNEFAQMSKVNRIGSNSLQDFESEYQELWDWLMDMESIVTDSHELMMSEEQQQHLYKGNGVEMSMWLPKKTQLLGRAESLRRSGAELPGDFQERIAVLTSKWDLLQRVLGDRTDASGSPAHADPRALLSPETNVALEQLQRRIKELRGWLRDTELLIFNCCLRRDGERDPRPSKQLQYFKSLCSEVRGRRRGVASVLRLCQSLLEQQGACDPEGDQQGACDPEGQRQALLLLTVNLERRWEAIVMQALQWQTRLQRALGTEQVPGTVIEPSFMDLHTPPEDSWEWDETDIGNDLIGVESGDLEAERSHACRSAVGSPGSRRPPRPGTYQVYSLLEVELYDRPQFPLREKVPARAGTKQPPTKSQSEDSSFCSAESLPDLLRAEGRGRTPGDSGARRRSESESGIVSEGEAETAEACLLRQAGDGSAGGLGSPGEGGVSDRDIDRLLERAERFARSSGLGDRPSPDGKQKKKKKKKKRRRDGAEVEEERRSRRSGREAVEILLDGRFSPLAQEGAEPNPGVSGATSADERQMSGRRGEAEVCASRGSSLDSLFAAGDLFPRGKDALHRSTSLESWLAPSKGAEEAGGSQRGLDLGLPAESTGELSKRTLELLARLENIQSPFAGKMTRSISDVTLRSSSLRLAGPGPPSLGGAPSSANESSATSLTEPSSGDDSSVGSEDAVVSRNRLAGDSNASFRKHAATAPPAARDEADASVSMVVNVSCASACTDDEDDSDLLSSSTLTLTEEELGVKEEEEEDGESSLASDEEYVGGGFASGLEYMKKELQNWIKPRSASRDKGELDLGDELRCGTVSRENALSAIATATANATAIEKRFLSRSALRLLESDASGVKADARQQGATRSSASQLVDDLENGNVENPPPKAKDEDDELLREEGTLFAKSGPLSSQAKGCILEVQLSGEIPCHSSRQQSPLPSPDRALGSGRGTHSQDQLASFLKDTQEADPGSPCCGRPPGEEDEEEEEESEDVHNFVMEIIDMASVVLKSKEARSDLDQHPPAPPSSAPVTQIRDKVLEHSHRPIHLRKGDFYSYLSLSSHDSDCGEVSTCVEDRSSTPLPYDVSEPDVHDEELLLFQACTEEVYLGPPLRYSPCASKRTSPQSRALPPDPIRAEGVEYQRAPGVSPGSTTAAGSQRAHDNEGPYLNPLPCETPIDTVECSADTKMLESNISPVMTKIRVSCSGANPLKEEGGVYINPKINCPPIRRSDREQKGPATQPAQQKNVRRGCGSKPTHKQSPRRERGSAGDGQGPQGRGPHPDGPAPCASRSRLAVRESGIPRLLAKRVSGTHAPPSSKPRP